MTPSVYLSLYVLAGSVGLLVSLLLGLNVALSRAGWSPQRRSRTVGGVALVLIGWFVCSLVLTWLGVFRGDPHRLPTIQYAIVLPILVGAWLIYRAPIVSAVIDATPQSWLVGVQLYRALGVIFLVLLGLHMLPGLFAWPAGVGDVLVGLLAPIVALAYARRPHESSGMVVGWNLLGIADLVVAVTTGMLTSPSSLLAPVAGTPSTIVSEFPLALIPVFLVPLSILLHLASLRKLQRTRSVPGSRIAASAV